MDNDLVTALAPALFGFLGTVAGAAITWVTTTSSHRKDVEGAALASCFDLLTEAIAAAEIEDGEEPDAARLDHALRSAMLAASAAGVRFNVFSAALMASAEGEGEGASDDDSSVVADARLVLAGSAESCFIAATLVIQILQMSWFERLMFKSKDGPDVAREVASEMKPLMQSLFAQSSMDTGRPSGK